MKTFLIPLFFLCSTTTWATDDGNHGNQWLWNRDPFERTNYRKAFDGSIVVPFKDVLLKDGTIHNMPKNFFKEENTKKSDELIIQIDDLKSEFDEDENQGKRHQEMVSAILSQLKKAKRNAALAILYESTVNMTIQGAITGAVYALIPNTFGSSLAVWAFLALAGKGIRDGGRSIYYYWYPGNDPLERWENLFAQRMTRIPHALWPQIIDVFGAARLGRYSYAKAQEYFKIAFNLPTLYRYPYHPPLRKEDVNDYASEINNFIDLFFQDYENSEETTYQLKAVTLTYLKQLTKDKDDRFVCVHLQGARGVGKTHFVEEWGKAINKTLKNDLPVEKLSIHSENTSELEGNKETPGQLLLALSRIGQKEKSCGIIICDEAEWLNTSLKSCAKKIFEPNLGSFVSEYLEGLTVSLKGNIVWFITNDPVEDEALASRFVHVNFPSLQKKSLCRMIEDKLPEFLEESTLDIEDVKQNNFFKKFLENSKTMRDVFREFPTIIEKIKNENKKKKLE